MVNNAKGFKHKTFLVLFALFIITKISLRASQREISNCIFTCLELKLHIPTGAITNNSGCQNPDVIHKHIRPKWHAPSFTLKVHSFFDRWQINKIRTEMFRQNHIMNRENVKSGCWIEFLNDIRWWFYKIYKGIKMQCMSIYISL